MSRILYFLLGVACFARVDATAIELNTKAPLTHGDSLAVPGAGRVVLVFLFISGLAIVAAYLVKRYLPTVGRKGPTGASIKLIDSYAPNTKLRVYLIEVEKKRVLVAEGTSGLAMLPMDGAPESSVTDG